MANRYWVGGNDTWDATAGSKWATTSGGAGGAAVPTAADAVFLDNGTGHGDVTIAAAAVALTLTCTGYTGTLTFNATLTVSGSITFVAGMTIAGTSDLIINATCTYTSGAKTLTGGLQCTGNGATYTIIGAFTVMGLVQITTGSPSFGGASITCAGGFTVSSGTVEGGSYTFILSGGTWSGAASVRCGLTFAGNVTISGTVKFQAATMTYTSGTITTTGSTIQCGNTTTFNLGAMRLNHLFFTFGSVTITLSSALNVDGTLTLPNDALTFAGAVAIFIGTLTNTSYNGSRIVTWAQGSTITIGTAFSACVGATPTNRPTWKTNSAGNTAAIVLKAGATQDIGYLDATDLNAAGGQTIFSFRGVLSNARNWINVFPPVRRSGQAQIGL